MLQIIQNSILWVSIVNTGKLMETAESLGILVHCSKFCHRTGDFRDCRTEHKQAKHLRLSLQHKGSQSRGTSINTLNQTLACTLVNFIPFLGWNLRHVHMACFHTGLRLLSWDLAYAQLSNLVTNKLPAVIGQPLQNSQTKAHTWWCPQGAQHHYLLLWAVGTDCSEWIAGNANIESILANTWQAKQFSSWTILLSVTSWKGTKELQTSWPTCSNSIHTLIDKRLRSWCSPPDHMLNITHRTHVWVNAHVWCSNLPYQDTYAYAE